ncbi:hypothetical protein L6R49_28775 [Myxococcota bacterium]|nr:hypothetical protein [Myxococcota bacterium]
MREHGALSALFFTAALVGCDERPEAPPAEQSCRQAQAGAVETWRCEDGPTLRYDRATAALSADGVFVQGRVSWPRLGPTLTMCLGDPLAEPVPGDPFAFRKLVWTASPRWRLELSGRGRCGLSGALELPLEADAPDPSALSVEGLAWSAGGREAAEAKLAEWVRQDALTLWPVADDGARTLLLRRLAADPHPDARAALLALQAADGVWATELQRAIEAQAQLSPR